jgi:hypothetical protein
MYNIKYELVYDSIDISLEKKIIEFLKTNSNNSGQQILRDFSKIVCVLINDNYPPYDVIVAENKEWKVDSTGETVWGDILALSYVDRQYLDQNKLYYFYDYIIPFEIPEKSLDQVKIDLYENTRKYLLSTKEIENYTDIGNYLGIILQKKDELLISKFEFKYYEPDVNKIGVWYDNFDGSVLLPDPISNVDVL